VLLRSEDHVGPPQEPLLGVDGRSFWIRPRVTNPIPDADVLNQTLTSLYNFQIEEVENPTSEQILYKLQEYLHRKFEPQDQLLTFFFGHGYFDDVLGQGFIVPSNAELECVNTI
jgi:hypothetical protein